MTTDIEFREDEMRFRVFGVLYVVHTEVGEGHLSRVIVEPVQKPEKPKTEEK